jgi:hypothetical protein
MDTKTSTRSRTLATGSVIGVIFLGLLAMHMANRGTLSYRLADMAETGPQGVPASTALALPTRTYLCVLSPYQTDVDDSLPFANQVNDFLKRELKKHDDGIWTLVHGTESTWELELISRMRLELWSPTHGAFPHNHLCGFAEDVTLHRYGGKRIDFKTAAVL